MAWSEKTLKHLVPVLAAGQFFLKKEPPDDSPSLKKRESPKNEKPFLFLPACPTPLRPSLFLPVPAKLPLFSMPSALSDPKVLQSLDTDIMQKKLDKAVKACYSNLGFELGHGCGRSKAFAQGVFC